MKYSLYILVVFLSSQVAVRGQSALKTQNVVLITLDGMRWQEVFTGADSTMMKQQKSLKDGSIKDKYWNADPAMRRTMLMPFLWTVVAKDGQLWGNRLLDNKVNVSNNQWFSYPGYNEILTGFADNERIHSNDKIYNPNKTVLEFIQGQPGFKGKVAAFTSWDCFPFIINDVRSGVVVNSGIVPAVDKTPSPQESLLNNLMTSVPNPLGDVRLDAFTFYYGLEYMKKNKPRVMYFSFDETDDFAHGGEYAAYLNSAHSADRYISELCQYLQSDSFYAQKTTIIITVDHGRGNNAEDWKHHGIKIANADQIWMAFLGPDTPSKGEMKSSAQLYQNQIAQTIAYLLGLNYKNQPNPGPPILPVMGR